MKSSIFLSGSYVDALNNFLPHNSGRSYNYSELYEFPLVEILVDLYLNADLKEGFYSIKHLEKMVQQYKKQNPSFKYTLKDIQKEGWIAIFLDRWDLTVYKRGIENILNSEGAEYYDIAEFLKWIINQDKSESVVLNKPIDILNKWKLIDSSVPDIEWFEKNYFVYKDKDGIYYAFFATCWTRKYL